MQASHHRSRHREVQGYSKDTKMQYIHSKWKDQTGLSRELSKGAELRTMESIWQAKRRKNATVCGAFPSRWSLPGDEHRVLDGKREEMQLGRYAESRWLRALNDDLRQLNFMDKPSAHFMNHQTSLSRQLTYSYLCVRSSFWEPVKDGIKLESRGAVRKKVGCWPDKGWKGQGAGMGDTADASPWEDKVSVSGLLNMKVTPTKANQLCLHYTLFQNVIHFLDWLRFPP